MARSSHVLGCSYKIQGNRQIQPSPHLRFIPGFDQSQDLSPVRPSQATGECQIHGSRTTTAHVEPIGLLGGTMGHNGFLPDLSNTLRAVSYVT